MVYIKKVPTKDFFSNFMLIYNIELNIFKIIDLQIRKKFGLAVDGFFYKKFISFRMPGYWKYPSVLQAGY